MENKLEIAQRKLQIADDNYVTLEMQLAESERKLEECRVKNKHLQERLDYLLDDADIDAFEEEFKNEGIAP